MVRATGNNITRATTAGVKNGLKIAAKTVAKTVENGVKAATSTKVDAVKTKTDQ